MDGAAAAKPGLPKGAKPKNPVRHKIYRYLKNQQELVTFTLQTQTSVHDRSGHHRSLLLNKSLSQNEKSLLDLSVMKKTNRHLACHLEASRVECRRHQDEIMRLRSRIHDLEVEVNANEQERKRFDDMQMQEPERTRMSRQMEEASVMLSLLTTNVLKMQQTLGGGEEAPTALPLLAVGCNDVPDALSRIILHRSVPQGRNDAPVSAKEGDGMPSVSHPADGDGGGLFNLSVIMETSHVLHELSLSLMEPCGPEEGAIVDDQSDRGTSQSEARSSVAGQRHSLPGLFEENSSSEAVNPQLHDAKFPPRSWLTSVRPVSKRPVDGFGEGTGRRLADAGSSCKSPTAEHRNKALFVDEAALSSPPVRRHPKEASALDPCVREKEDMPPICRLVELGMPYAAGVRRPRGLSIYEELSPISAKVKRNERMAVCETSLSSSEDSSDEDWVPGRRQLKAGKQGATKKTAAGCHNRRKTSRVEDQQQVLIVKSRQPVPVKGPEAPPAKQTAKTTDCVPTSSGTKDSLAVSSARNGSHPENSVGDDNRLPLSEITHHRAANTQRQEETTDGGQRTSRRARKAGNYKEQKLNV